MRTMCFTQAIDDALAQAMADDPRIIVLGEDIPLVRRNLLVRFDPDACEVLLLARAPSWEQV